jgi:hypothetical protein
MKRRTLWIIGITTAIVTVVGLNAALGSRYRMHNRYNHHACMQDKRDGENKMPPASESTSDTTTRR